VDLSDREQDSSRRLETEVDVSSEWRARVSPAGYEETRLIHSAIRLLLARAWDDGLHLPRVAAVDGEAQLEGGQLRLAALGRRRRLPPQVYPACSVGHVCDIAGGPRAVQVS
jgi:hypothetical protein